MKRCAQAAPPVTTAEGVTSEMLQVAQHLADEAAAITRPLFRAKLDVDLKDDRSPVTEADRKAEFRMRAIIQDQLPSHAVFGEESGYEPGSGTPCSPSGTDNGNGNGLP
jgi:fructose-1,6-bisphosphatase/inositol monophosphatase family enzyme